MSDEIDLGEIDQVLRELDEIIDWSLEEGSPFGYFPALYRKVTASVRDGIISGSFEDGARMSHLDKVFADRYLDAFREYRAGRPVTEVWKTAFNALALNQPLILQHLLLGMNAHINLDLGIAAVEVAPGPSYEGLKADFLEINRILLDNLDPAQNKIGEFSPWMDWLDRLGGVWDEMLGKFGMKAVRSVAWDFGGRLARLSEPERALEISKKDEEVAQWASMLLSPPGFLLRSTLWWIRRWEEKDPRPVIRALAGR